MDWSWTGELHHRDGANPEWCRATEASVECESIPAYTFIWSYAKMYVSHFTDICIRKDRLHSTGWKSKFSAYFYLEIQEHNPTTTQRLEGMTRIAVYIHTTDNIVISLPFFRELLLCIFLSPTVSLRHFDPYIQADIWLKEKEPRDHRDAKLRPSVLSELGGMRWMGHPGLLDGDQLQQGYAERDSACGSAAPVSAGIGQVTTGWCHYKTWMLTGAIPAPPCSPAVGGRNDDAPALWLSRQEARRM